MAKVDQFGAVTALEGGDIATIALMAVMGDLMPKDAIFRYVEIIKAVHQFNQKVPT